MADRRRVQQLRERRAPAPRRLRPVSNHNVDGKDDTDSDSGVDAVDTDQQRRQPMRHRRAQSWSSQRLCGYATAGVVLCGVVYYTMWVVVLVSASNMFIHERVTNRTRAFRLGYRSARVENLKINN